MHNPKHVLVWNFKFAFSVYLIHLTKRHIAERFHPHQTLSMLRNRGRKIWNNRLCLLEIMVNSSCTFLLFHVDSVTRKNRIHTPRWWVILVIAWRNRLKCVSDWLFESESIIIVVTCWYEFYTKWPSRTAFKKWTFCLPITSHTIFIRFYTMFRWIKVQNMGFFIFR